MVQYVGFIFLIFCGVVLLVCGATLIGHVSASGYFPSFTPGFGPGGGASSGGLAIVDFSLFAKNGKGWGAITQGYGNTSDSYLYIDHWHNGIDIAADYGAPIHSPVMNGVVLATGNQDNYCPGRGFGKFVVVEDDANHLDLMFAHLGTIVVSPGASVAKGATLGTVGTTGLETGPHLHLSIFESGGFTVAPAHGCGPYPEGHDVNPVQYLGTTYQ
jgi:murein DD-endopeptidase MepM/ murein hydrolase activator NlpD